MGLGLVVKDVWGRMWGAGAKTNEPARKTSALGAGLVWSPYRVNGARMEMPKATIANLRRFAETPVARRAVNCIKDRIACMDWRIDAKPDADEPSHADGEAGVMHGAPRLVRALALRRALEEPNGVDSFRTLIEQVIEDLLVSGCGAVELAGLPTNGRERSFAAASDTPPFRVSDGVDASGVRAKGWATRSPGGEIVALRLYPVDAATVQVNGEWSGAADEPRYAQVSGAGVKATPLLDDELMYVRLNPRTHSVFGLGKLEVAFESINQFLLANRYAGKLAGNSVVQYALWMKDRTPEQQERLTEWWQEEVEGSGRVPVLSSEEKPEVLRLAGGTDAELRIGWQEFLLQMIANAFDLPAMMLGVSHDVNRSTAQELADEAFQNAIVPLAKLLAEHITRDVIAKKLGWSDLRFVWNDLESRDETAEVEMQTKLLAAGVLTVEEVRAMRGLEAREQGLGIREQGTGSREKGLGNRD